MPRFYQKLSGHNQRKEVCERTLRRVCTLESLRAEGVVAHKHDGIELMVLSE
jgi:hypothetical protein